MRKLALSTLVTFALLLATAMSVLADSTGPGM